MLQYRAILLEKNVQHILWKIYCDIAAYFLQNEHRNKEDVFTLAGILTNIAVYPDIYRDIAAYAAILRNIVAYPAILRDIAAYAAIFYSTTFTHTPIQYAAISWHIAAYSMPSVYGLLPILNILNRLSLDTTQPVILVSNIRVKALWLTT